MDVCLGNRPPGVADAALLLPPKTSGIVRLAPRRRNRVSVDAAPLNASARTAARSMSAWIAGQPALKQWFRLDRSFECAQRPVAQFAL
jgi:hypothetical protein